MKISNIDVLGGLSENTTLYRYIGLSQFMSFVETHSSTLTQVKQWQDTWEIPFFSLVLQLQPNSSSSGLPIYSGDMIYGQVYGQCWSSNEESDAMWRIYSPNREGLMIATTVKQFGLIAGIKNATLAPVVYFDDVEDGSNIVIDRYGPIPTIAAYLKRRAFEHEQEVRLAMLNTRACLHQVHKDCPHIGLGLNPTEFIKEIIIDPRASDWYVKTIQEYCRNAGFAVIPRKSLL